MEGGGGYIRGRKGNKKIFSERRDKTYPRNELACITFRAITIIIWPLSKTSTRLVIKTMFDRVW